MGTHYLFRCDRCGMAVEISGGPDRGIFIRTDTMYCLSCHLLVDVSVGHCDDAPKVSRVHETREDEGLGRCPKCLGSRLTQWRSGEPCPLCGGRIENRGVTADWD